MTVLATWLTLAFILACFIATSFDVVHDLLWDYGV